MYVCSQDALIRSARSYLMVVTLEYLARVDSNKTAAIASAPHDLQHHRTELGVPLQVSEEHLWSHVEEICRQPAEQPAEHRGRSHQGFSEPHE